MSKLRFSLNILAVAAFVLTVTSMASAQATRTWVSGVGDDANPCSRTAPCKTFAGGPTGEAGILASSTFGVSINIQVNSGSNTVELRNLSINGAGTGTFGV